MAQHAQLLVQRYDTSRAGRIQLSMQPPREGRQKNGECERDAVSEAQQNPRAV
jgi:hypothetical protein